MALLRRWGLVGRQQASPLQQVKDLFQPPAAPPKLAALEAGLTAFDVLRLVLAAGDFGLGADAAVEAADPRSADAAGAVGGVDVEHRPADRLNAQIQP